MRTRYVPMALAAMLAMVVSVPAAAAGGPFPDVPEDHTHAEAIEVMAGAGIVVGYPDGHFRPEEDVTRAQFATILATVSHMATGDEPPFDDVPPLHPHADGITAAAEWGIVRGYPDGTYRPEHSLTRGQIASTLAEAYDLDAEGDPSFDDVGADHPHAQGIAALAEHGIAAGYDDGTYRPAASVSRAQVVALIHRTDPHIV